MRILATVMKSYYGQPDAIEPMFRQFTEAPRRLGHEVDHFDHARTRREVGFDLCGERFVETVQQGRYDMVIFQTTGQDQMPLTAIQQAGRYAPVVAWNSDDDWQWASLSRPRAPYFTYMVTTYPDVYEANRSAHPNLLLSQWACLDLGADPSRPKDLDFTFAGQLYGERISECRHLRRHAGLQVFGRGARLVERPWLAWLPLRLCTCSDFTSGCEGRRCCSRKSTTSGTAARFRSLPWRRARTRNYYKSKAELSSRGFPER